MSLFGSNSVCKNSKLNRKLSGENNRDRSRSPIFRENYQEIELENNLIQPQNPEIMAIPLFKMEYLQILPDFDGNQSLLSEFITISEQLINRFYNPNDANDFQNTLILRSIKNKVKGDAAISIASYNITTWLNLKNALLATYSDKRDLQTLIIELCNMRQGNLKPLEFYSKVQDNLNLQTSYVNMHSAANEINVLIENSRKLALRVFLKHLNGSLGDYLSTRNPDSLNSALQMLTNDFNINDKSQPRFNKTAVPNKSLAIGYNRPQYTPQYNVQRFPNFVKPYTPFNAQGQTQNFKPSTNVFKPKTNFVPTHKPTPMSISTRNTSQQHNPNYFKNNYRPPNNFNIEELHNVQEYCDDDTNCIVTELNETSFNEINTLEQENVENYDENYFLGNNASDEMM